LNACSAHAGQDPSIQAGAAQTSLYVPALKNKNIALIANHTSMVENTHLVDTLMRYGIKIKKIFAPEHGFRGTQDAGKEISDSLDLKTGIPVISLYGVKKKPSVSDLYGIDIVIFDIQDVGVRFFTYISTLHYIMEACAENKISLIILDRPNPLGFYTDGPVLDLKYQSFVGMHPVPVVYGMTIGELALMINGEKWLADGVTCKLTIVPCKNYDHNSRYQLPIPPSPNLNSMESVYLYPSLCFFEGTIMSVGRGTDYPFRVAGSPDYPVKGFSFTPVSNVSNKNPLYKGTRCYGMDLRNYTVEQLQKQGNIQLSWILHAYQTFPKNKAFFNAYFNSLAGNSLLKQQITNLQSEVEIKASWEKDLHQFRNIRKKYLIYTDYDSASSQGN
jgi:uncharacterized protein YbbC (DUF1343 family)